VNSSHHWLAERSPPERPAEHSDLRWPGRRDRWHQPGPGRDSDPDPVASRRARSTGGRRRGGNQRRRTRLPQRLRRCRLADCPRCHTDQQLAAASAAQRAGRTSPIPAAEAAALNACWEGDARERYWLEITDRVDLGADRHAPQRDASGNPTSGCSLIWRVQRGDLAFHYDKNKRSIHSWSRAVGGVTEAPVIWLSHRAAATPHRQPDPAAGLVA
jgi:hypothetical protein